MTKQEALDRADACERATAAANRNAVELKTRINGALRLLRKASESNHAGDPLDCQEAIEDALEILEGKGTP